MERKVSSFVAGLVLFLTVVSSFVLLNFPNLHTLAVNKQSEYKMRFANKISVLSAIKESSDLTATAGNKGTLRIELPTGIELGDVEYSLNAVEECLSVKIPQAGEDYTDKYPLVGAAKCIEDVTFFSTGTYGQLDIIMDSIYEAQVSIEDNYLYLKFIDPQEKYPYVVVVDAGHGGKMPGATRQGLMEKDIDLAISNYLYEMLDENDQIGVYVTRDTDANPSFAKRVGLANDAKADLFVSIHNNAMTSSANSYITGTEVLYSKSDKSGKSKEFANTLLDAVSASFETKALGLKDGDDIYIVRTSQVPVALVEVGFMSNSDELHKLNDATWQKKAAQGMYSAICAELGISE